MVARAVNKKFGMDFDHDYVINHLWTLRTRFMDMCSCFKINGARWDKPKKKKMITLGDNLMIDGRRYTCSLFANIFFSKTCISLKHFFY